MVKHSLDKELSIKYSVIVPCFNGENYLDACLESWRVQSVDVFWEILLVDDGSMDGSLTKARAWTQRFTGNSRLRVLQSVENQGLPRARKFGLSEARGQFILFCDVDDVVSMRFLSVVDLAFSSSEIDILVTPVCRFVEKPEFNLVPYQLTICKSDEALREFGMNHFGGGWVWNKIWRKELIENAFNRLTDLGRFDVDYELTTLGYSMSKSVGSATGLCYGYRVTPGSMVNSEKELGFGFTEQLNNYRNLCLSGISRQNRELVRSVYFRRMLWSHSNSENRMRYGEDQNQRCLSVLREIAQVDPEFIYDLLIAQQEMLFTQRGNEVQAQTFRDLLLLILRKAKRRLTMFYTS